MGGDRAKRNAPKRHRRRSIRLKGYDYTRPGAYFVTICTHNREPLFGRVVDGKMVLNEYGEIVREEWFRSARIRDEIELFPGEFVVMPNHVHGIVWIVETHDRTPTVGATGRSPLRIQSAHPRGPVARSLGSFIAGFKSAVTRRINIMRGTPGARVWQRNYWEHIIRDDRALDAIRRYIAENPLRWHLDRYNPDRQGTDPLAHEIWNMMQTPVGAQRRCAPTGAKRRQGP